MTISVSGGAESIAARTEDLLATAVLFDRAAAELEDIADYAGSWLVRMTIEGYDLILRFALDAALDEIRGLFSPPRLAAYALRVSAIRLRFTVQLYESREDGILSAIGAQLVHLTEAGFLGLGTLIGTGSPSAAAQAFLTSDPALVDAAADAVLFSGLEQSVGTRYPDGHPVVRDLGTDPVQIVAPHDVADLIGQLAVRNLSPAGEVSVSFVIGADGRRRAIVDIPGTKSWNPGRTDDVTSLSTNARALVGESTTYERGVLDAMQRAGVTRTDQVLLVGHSEGGMVAVTAARDAVRSGRFDVTHVVTAGSPIGRTVADLPSSVRVLALENEADIIPELDGAANPARPNITTVRFDNETGTVSGNHGLGESYSTGAGEVDRSTDASIRAFTDSAAGFLDGDGEDTRLFLISRKY